jgi:hypothetical protein
VNKNVRDFQQSQPGFVTSTRDQPEGLPVDKDVFVSQNALFAPTSIIGGAIGTIGLGPLVTIDESVPKARCIGVQILTSAELGSTWQFNKALVRFKGFHP